MASITTCHCCWGRTATRLTEAVKEIHAGAVSLGDDGLSPGFAGSIGCGIIDKQAWKKVSENELISRYPVDCTITWMQFHND
jgi:hypothetical protein